MRRSILLSVFLSSALSFSLGCTKEDSGEQDNSDPGTSPASVDSFRTSCGTVFEGEEKNPISADDAKRGAVSVMGPNLLSMKLKKGSQLVKLHGLDVPYDRAKKTKAEALLEKLSAEGDAYFYPAEPDCVVQLEESPDGAEEGVVGAIFSAKGKSFSETLLKEGVGEPTTDVCRGALIASCYRALAEEAQPTPIPIPTENPEYEGPATAAGFILWKPVSDSDGRLAVHSVPYGASVIVDGEKGRNQGAGNGYGSLARFRKAGCAYGKKVRLELLTGDGSNFMFGDKDFAVVPDGCRRWVISKDGKATPNSK